MVHNEVLFTLAELCTKCVTDRLSDDALFDMFECITLTLSHM